jgi:glutaredoxin
MAMVSRGIFFALVFVLLAGCCAQLEPQKPQPGLKVTEEPAQKIEVSYPNFNNPVQRPDVPVLELNSTKVERNASDVQAEDISALLAEARADDGSNVYYFYSALCPFSARTTPFVDATVGDASGYLPRKYEIYFDAVNYALYTAFADRAKVKAGDRAVPVLFIGKRMLTGEPEIKDGLATALEECKRSDCGKLFEK